MLFALFFQDGLTVWPRLFSNSKSAASVFQVLELQKWCIVPSAWLAFLSLIQFCFALMKYNVNGVTFKGLINAPSALTHISIWLSPKSSSRRPLPGSHNHLWSAHWGLVGPSPHLSCVLAPVVLFLSSVYPSGSLLYDYSLCIFTTFDRKVLPAELIWPSLVFLFYAPLHCSSQAATHLLGIEMLFTLETLCDLLKQKVMPVLASSAYWVRRNSHQDRAQWWLLRKKKNLKTLEESKTQTKTFWNHWLDQTSLRPLVLRFHSKKTTTIFFYWGFWFNCQ